MRDLLESSELDTILERWDQAVIDKNVFRYNLFELSSYNNQLENFHSDVIASLLDPNGLHGEGDLFLREFLNYLKEQHGLTIEQLDFLKTSVKREQGRIDISVIDSSSKKAIIIENKINDATDMDDQLTRYHYWCCKRGYDVKAILYLSLRGLKKAPPLENNPEQEIMVKNVAAFCNNSSDLVNGWLRTCQEKCVNAETKALVIQYCKLLTFLGFDSMEKTIMDEFYLLVNTRDMLSKMDKIIELHANISTYRTDKFQSSIDDYKPFTKSARWKPDYMIFEQFREGKDNFKIDVWFSGSGSAWIRFWNPGRQNDEGSKALAVKLNNFPRRDEFHQAKDNKLFLTRIFRIDDYGSMDAVDKDVLDLTNALLMHLREGVC